MPVVVRVMQNQLFPIRLAFCALKAYLSRVYTFNLNVGNSSPSPFTVAGHIDKIEIQLFWWYELP